MAITAGKETRVVRNIHHIETHAKRETAISSETGTHKEIIRYTSRNKRLAGSRRGVEL